MADSALYTVETLRELEGMAWITRVPETLRAAREALEKADGFAPWRTSPWSKWRTMANEADHAKGSRRRLLPTASKGR
ncbi:MAG: hypothetical protein WA970_16015 [Gammaproteobacteria bacterium]